MARLKGVVVVHENLGMLLLFFPGAGVDHQLENAFGTLHHRDLPCRL